MTLNLGVCSINMHSGNPSICHHAENVGNYIMVWILALASRESHSLVYIDCHVVIHVCTACIWFIRLQPKTQHLRPGQIMLWSGLVQRLASTMLPLVMHHETGRARQRAQLAELTAHYQVQQTNRAGIQQ